MRIKTSQPFDLAAFKRFVSTLKIDTKEMGQILLGKHLLAPQQFLIDEIAKGMQEGVRDFKVLKARQEGISTICLAFDLFWIFRYPALSGAVITHDEPARDKFRATLDMYYFGLPEEFKRERRKNNIHGMLFANKSSLSFRVAGVRASGGGALGRSAAYPFIHATECSSYGDPEGLQSLVASLAESNPIRFYTWESTARGFNAWYDIWNDAKKAITQKAIFIGWWKNELYRAPRHSDIWRMYWGKKGHLTDSERAALKEVKALYGAEIDDTQLAWYRWKLSEGIGDELMMRQEYPFHEDEAFTATGSQFFTSLSISDGYKKERQYDRARVFRVHIGKHFQDTSLLATPEKVATLKIWEEPKKKGVYALGADPAYGSSEWADRFCISVWRGYADRFVQVAEFVDPDMATYSFAWVLAYLAGAYEPCVVNLEINGPGQGVLGELQNMRRAVVASGRDSPGGLEARTLMSVTKNISSYLYRRLDTFGAPGAIHTMMNADYKERMLNTFRDYFERDMIVIRSRGLLDEMKSIERQEGQIAVGARGRAKDDRVMSAALACLAWNDQQRTRLLAMNATYDLVEASENQGPAGVVDRMVADYLSKLKIKMVKPEVRR
jgi:hypothetical protein